MNCSKESQQVIPATTNTGRDVRPACWTGNAVVGQGPSESSPSTPCWHWSRGHWSWLSASLSLQTSGHTESENKGNLFV